jgi:hypothetical protein
MMKLAIFVVLILTTSSLFFGQTVPAKEAAPDTLISLQRGACEARCAVYRLIIFADGTVIYEGRYNVRQAGLVKSLMPQLVLKKLIGDLEAGGFFELQDNYGYGNTAGCASIDPDGGPTAILSVSNQGRSKTVLHSHRCVGPAPTRLTEMEDQVDHAAGVAKWIK